MNNASFLKMMVDKVAHHKRANSRERRRLKRISKKFPEHWVRTPNRTWKVFGRDDNHKWRRWRGWPYSNNRNGSWEYASDRTVAHACIAAMNPDLSTTRESA